MTAASTRTDCDMSNTVHDLERADCSGKLDKQCRYRGAVRCQYVSLLDLQQHRTDAGDVLQDLHSILAIPAETTMSKTCDRPSTHRRQDELDRSVGPALERVLDHQLRVRLALKHCESPCTVVRLQAGRPMSGIVLQSMT
jgi:hypothetical protein